MGFNPQKLYETIWSDGTKSPNEVQNLPLFKNGHFGTMYNPIFIQNCPIDLIKKKSFRSLHFVTKWHIWGIPDGTKSILSLDFVPFSEDFVPSQPPWSPYQGQGWKSANLDQVSPIGAGMKKSHLPSVGLTSQSSPINLQFFAVFESLTGATLLALRPIKVGIKNCVYHRSTDKYLRHLRRPTLIATPAIM